MALRTQPRHDADQSAERVPFERFQSTKAAVSRPICAASRPSASA
jgi:hypothetical protein